MMDLMQGMQLAGASMELGTVERVDADGTSIVRTDATADLVRCSLLFTAESRSLCLVTDDRVLLWRAADETEGIVVGRVGPSRGTPAAVEPAPEAGTPNELVIEARDQLTLRVGDGSITIRADGKILIRGTDLVSHARRMNRIKGGAVSIN